MVLILGPPDHSFVRDQLVRKLVYHKQAPAPSQYVGRHRPVWFPRFEPPAYGMERCEELEESLEE